MPCAFNRKFIYTFILSRIYTFLYQKSPKLFRQLVCQTRSWVFAKFFGLKFKLRKRNEIPDFRWASLSLRERIRVWYGIMKLYTSWNTYELPYQSRDSYLGTKLLGGRSFFLIELLWTSSFQYTKYLYNPFSLVLNRFWVKLNCALTSGFEFFWNITSFFFIKFIIIL